MPDACTEYVCALDDFACIQKKIWEPIQKNSLYKHMLASSVGSIVSTVTLNPIAVVKVKIQNVNPFAISQTVSHTIQNIIKEKGFKGFYAGTPMGIMMSVPNTVLYMTAYEEVKVILNRKVNNSNLNHLIPGIAGACARMFAVSITTPLELIRTIQTGGVNKSIPQIAREIVTNRGYSGLYGGWSSTILRDCPFSAIYWYVFEAIRPRYALLFSEQSLTNGINTRSGVSNSKIKNGEFSVFATFCSGATAGMLAAMCTHPYDVIKTQQQMAMMNKQEVTVISNTINNVTSSAEKVMSKIRSVGHHTDTLVNTSHGSTSMVNCRSGQLCSFDGNKSPSLSSFVASESQPIQQRLQQVASSQQITLRYLYTNGGVSALYRGLSMRLVSVIPASAIMVTIYEKIKSIEF